MSKTLKGPDGQARCRWCASAPEFLNYHDTEWGFPVDDDYRLFEKLSLESFQSGLSWRTILVKRENFREAFDKFNFNKIARYSQRDIDRLLNNQGIVRHKGKIDAVINNAKQAQKIVLQEGSLAAFIWRYQPNASKHHEPQSTSTSEESVALSKELKKRGWKFIGPTTAYAFLQAMGLINDHVEECMIWSKVELARRNFNKPN